MKINWSVRARNPLWLAQMALAVLAPLLAYAGLTMQDMTRWSALGGLLWEAVQNPYVLSLVAVSVWNAVTDPTTRGLADSAQAMGYVKPKE